MYYGTDVRGSVRTITDVRGEVLAARNYGPFGVPLGGRLAGDDYESCSRTRARAVIWFLNRDTFTGSLTNPLICWW